MHEEFLRQALGLAIENVANGGGPFGAIIVKDNRIISASGNRVTANLDPTAHAEIIAIREACRLLNDFQLTDCILYTSCEPCPMCLGAIYWSRLSKVYYACSRFEASAAGFDDSFIYDELLKSPEDRAIPMQNLLLANANQPFRTWNELGSKILY